MGVGAVEQICNFITGAMESRQVLNSSRFYVDVHQTAGVRLAISVGLPLLVLAAVYYWFTKSIVSVKFSKSGLQLPPGSPWILPLCGETFQLAYDMDSYVTSRVQRYGETFSSHLFGVHTVMVTNVDAIRHVLASPHHKEFTSIFPPMVRKVIGPQSVSQIPVGTPMHTTLRRLYYRRTKAENVSSLIPNIDAVVQTCLNSWAELGTVKAYPELKKVVFSIALSLVFGEDKPDREEKEIFHQHINNLVQGVSSLPINIPGTGHNKAVKAIKAIHDLTERIMEKRKGTKGDNHALHQDLLGDLMNFSISEGITGLTHAQILDNVTFAVSIAHQTSTSSLTWLLKFLAESPTDVQEIIAEHKAIADSKGSKEYELTYDDTLRMPASARAFMETNRVANPAFGTVRTATNDGELNGNLIPKGWSVILSFRPTHYNPKYFPDPCKFNPSRFKTSPPPPGTFLSFGTGPRTCPGVDLAKTEALVFLHRLVLGYRWELLDNRDAGVTFPVPAPKGGLPIKVSRIEQ
ncbi:unnamed protein product [Calypogeia fissa]